MNLKTSRLAMLWGGSSEKASIADSSDPIVLEKKSSKDDSKYVPWLSSDFFSVPLSRIAGSSTKKQEDEKEKKKNPLDIAIEEQMMNLLDVDSDDEDEVVIVGGLPLLPKEKNVSKIKASAPTFIPSSLNAVASQKKIEEAVVAKYRGSTDPVLVDLLLKVCRYFVKKGNDSIVSLRDMNSDWKDDESIQNRGGTLKFVRSFPDIFVIKTGKIDIEISLNKMRALYFFTSVNPGKRLGGSFRTCRCCRCWSVKLDARA